MALLDLYAKSSTNCDTHLAESLLQIHSGVHCVNINICFVDKCLKKTVTGIFIVFCMWSNWLFVICVNRNIHFGRNAILCIIMHKIYLKIHSFRNDTNSERGFPSRCLCLCCLKQLNVQIICQININMYYSASAPIAT